MKTSEGNRVEQALVYNQLNGIFKEKYWLETIMV